MKWFEYKISLISFSEEEREIVYSELFDLGAVGVEYTDIANISCFFAEDLLEIANSYFNARHIEVNSSTEVEDVNWVSECQAILKPVYAGRFLITPFTEEQSTAEFQQANQILVRPGLGFGTGHHSTTYLLLNMLQHYYVMNLEPKRIVDVGTGSGILAIAAHRLFKGEVLAIDNDPLALTNTIDNLQLNKLGEEVKIKEGYLEPEDGKFDLIIANIYAEVLLDYEETFKACLNKGGILLVSGIMEGTIDSFLDGYGNWTKLVHFEEIGDNGLEWHALLYKKLQ